MRAAGCYFWTLCPKALYKGIRIVHIVIVEDVLVLAYGPQRHTSTGLHKPRSLAACGG